MGKIHLKFKHQIKTEVKQIWSECTFSISLDLQCALIAPEVFVNKQDLSLRRWRSKTANIHTLNVKYNMPDL